MAEIFINDVRANDDPSLEPVPRITTFEQLQFHLGLDVDTSLGEDRAKEGEQYWALVGFEVRTGPRTYIPQVKLIDNSPAEKIIVFRHFPGADNFPSAVNPQYFVNGVGGFTDANGVNGFGFSDSSVTGANGGPDFIWVSADPPGGSRQHSDMASRLGWHGATNHLVANPIFRATVKSDNGNGGNGNVDSTSIRLFIGEEKVYEAKIVITVET